MMTIDRTRGISIAAVVSTAFLLAQPSVSLSEDANAKPDRPTPPKVDLPKSVRLSKKAPFTHVPKLAPSSQVVAMHYVQFDTKEGGEPILARVFLTAVHPPMIPGKKLPSRLFGTGIEVETPVRPPATPFIADFFVDKQFVDKIPKTSSYTVNLGDVKYRIVTTREP